MSKKNIIRTTIGFVVAPLVPALLLIPSTLVSGRLSEGPIGLMLAMLFGYPVALLMGLPLFFLFRFFQMNGIAGYVLAGFAFGIALDLFINPRVPPSGGFFSHQAPLVITCAVVATTAFWLIVRPDRFHASQ